MKQQELLKITQIRLLIEIGGVHILPRCQQASDGDRGASELVKKIRWNTSNIAQPIWPCFVHVNRQLRELYKVLQ